MGMFLLLLGGTNEEVPDNGMVSIAGLYGSLAWGVRLNGRRLFGD